MSAGSRLVAVDLVVASSLTRAIETADIVLPPVDSEPSLSLYEPPLIVDARPLLWSAALSVIDWIDDGAPTTDETHAAVL